MEEIRIKQSVPTWVKTLIAIGVLLICVTVFVAWFRKTYRINLDTDIKVYIIGDHNRYTEQEIRDYVFDEWYEKYSPTLKLYYRFKKIAPLTYTEKITIDFPDDGPVVVKAYEKVPIGCLLVMNNYLYFDGDGMIVDSAAENTEGLPVIEGLEYKSLTLGKIFETKRSGLFPVIMNLVKQLQKYNVEADVIRFLKDDSVTMNCDGNQVILGVRDAYDVQINVLSGILEEVAKGSDRYLLDLTHVETGKEKIVANVLSEETQTKTEEDEPQTTTVVDTTGEE